VEQNIFTVLLNAATLFYGGKYLERAWGSREFAKFIVIIAVIPNVVVALVYLLFAAIGASSVSGYEIFSQHDCITSCALSADSHL
jgi:membrane associated rhomboid family serine protease